MKRPIPFLLSFACIIASMAVSAAAKDAPEPAKAADYGRYAITDGRVASVLTSASTGGVRFKTSAGADTFCLYGRGRVDLCGVEGRFQDPTGIVPQILNHDQGCDEPGGRTPVWAGTQCWLGVDLTDERSVWRLANASSEPDASIQTCIAALGSTGGSSNTVAWAGRSSSEEPGWVTAPGYGNNWTGALQWSAVVDDPGAGQTVGLSFYFHHDSEPIYDFFSVEYDSFNTTVPVYSVDGSSAPFAAPGVHYPGDVVTGSITYGADGYAGANHDEIILRMNVTSDFSFSDEDGGWPTECGLAMV